jgi:hypothetical protein
VAKILYAGDAFVQTGFGRVAEYLLPALAKEHDVHVLATNWRCSNIAKCILQWWEATTRLAAIVSPS